MTDNRLDKEIKEALLHSTKDIEKLRESIWSNIESKITMDKSSSIINSKNRSSRISLISSFPKVAAVIALMIMLVNSEPGIAAIGKVKSMLVPEKKIVQEVEGMEEQSDVTLKESSAGYTIYIDDSYFNLEKIEGKDKITPKIKPENTTLPEMYMEISQDTKKTPSQLYSELEKKLKANFKNVTSIGQVATPIQALNLRAKSGTKWNDKIIVYYLVDNNQGGSYIIKQQYFLEAEEGMGARFDNMLKEFRIAE